MESTGAFTHCVHFPWIYYVCIYCIFIIFFRFSFHDKLFEDIDTDLNNFEQLYPGLNDRRIDQYYDCKKFNDNFIGDGVNDSSVSYVNIRSLNVNGESLVVYLLLFNGKFDWC